MKKIIKYFKETKANGIRWDLVLLLVVLVAVFSVLGYILDKIRINL